MEENTGILSALVGDGVPLRIELDMQSAVILFFVLLLALALALLFYAQIS